MHLPKKFPPPNIFALATCRGVKTKAVVITMALVCTLFSGFALAGQGPSQWCSDNGNNSEIHLLDDPVTFNLEPGPYFGNPAYLITCYSTTPYGSAAPEVTGGNVWVNHSTQNVHCFSDPAAMVKLDCWGGANLNTQNPTSPSASADAGGQVTILGTPVPISGTGAGIAVGCTSGTVAVSVTGCANGQYAGISGTGNSSGGTLALSGTGCAASSQQDGSVAASGGLSGCTSYGSIAANGMGNAESHRIAISGTKDAYASTLAAISGTGSAGPAAGVPLVVVSGTGGVYGNMLAVSGTGVATSLGDGLVPGVAISGTNAANGRDVAISGTGQSASDATILSVTADNGSVALLGQATWQSEFCELDGNPFLSSPQCTPLGTPPQPPPTPLTCEGAVICMEPVQEGDPMMSAYQSMIIEELASMVGSEPISSEPISWDALASQLPLLSPNGPQTASSADEQHWYVAGVWFALIGRADHPNFCNDSTVTDNGNCGWLQHIYGHFWRDSSGQWHIPGMFRTYYPARSGNNRPADMWKANLGPIPNDYDYRWGFMNKVYTGYEPDSRASFTPGKWRLDPWHVANPDNEAVTRGAFEIHGGNWGSRTQGCIRLPGGAITGLKSMWNNRTTNNRQGSPMYIDYKYAKYA